MSKDKQSIAKNIRKKTKRIKTPFTFKVTVASFSVLVILSFFWIFSATILQTVATGYTVRGQRVAREIRTIEGEIENLNIMISEKTNYARLRAFAEERGLQFNHDRIRVITINGNE